MKVAIVMAGYPRSFENTSKLFFQNVTFGDWPAPDFFLHFFDGESNNKVLDTYKPVDWICEKEVDLEYTKGKDRYIANKCINIGHFHDPTVTHYKNRIYSQFRNLGMCFSLIPKYKYDVVFKFRYDFLIKNKFDFSKLDMSFFNIPSGEDHWGGLNDRACISSYSNMSIYFDFYKHMEYLNTHTVFHPESLLKSYLCNHLKLSDSIKRFDCDMNTIVRI